MMIRLLFSGLSCLLLWSATYAAELERASELSEVRGSIVFHTYCVLCHGPNADGNGRAAKNYNPRPADLTESTKTDAYKMEIISKGGAAMNRSPFMPPWGQELTQEQISDVVQFLRAVNVTGMQRDAE